MDSRNCHKAPQKKKKKFEKLGESLFFKKINIPYKKSKRKNP